MAYIQVEVDLEEFDDDEILEELKYRIIHKNFTKEDIVDLVETIRNMYPDVIKEIKQLPIKTLDDEMKLEHLEKVWDSYSSSEIETLLKEKSI